MAKPRTRTKLKLSDRTIRPRQVFKINARAAMELPNRWAYIDPWEQSVHGKLWGRVTGTKPWELIGRFAYVYDGGRWHARFRWSGKIKRAEFRVQTLPSNILRGSRSRIVRIRTVGRTVQSPSSKGQPFFLK